jgi:hypothetical protein
VILVVFKKKIVRIRIESLYRVLEYGKLLRYCPTIYAACAADLLLALLAISQTVQMTQTE